MIFPTLSRLSIGEMNIVPLFNNFNNFVSVF